MKHLLTAVALLASAVVPCAAQTSAPSASAGQARSAAAIADLGRDISRILSAPGWRGHEYGVLVVSLDRGDTLFSHNPDLPLVPASNTKLYSTAAALEYLGPDFRFSTLLLADGPTVGGTLEGDLILYGTGDPALSKRLGREPVEVLRGMADSLAAAGIHTIRGDVVGDGSFFDDEWIGPGWEPHDLDHWYGAPVGALSFSENVISLTFRPSAAGRPATVRTIPETHGLALEDRVLTRGSGANRVSIERRNGMLVATGQVRAGGSGLTRSVPVVDPANFAAAALAAVLRERGIEVEGEVRSVYAPSESRVTIAPGAPYLEQAPRVVATHLSAPLDTIARVTNRVSHNLFAEALLKAVGRVVGGEGSYRSGAAAVRTFLADVADAPPEGIEQIDGSGLSRNNLLTARTTIALLAYMMESGTRDSYFASLPPAGDPDGLRLRMRGTPAAGNLRAKTGTVRSVSALSGYVTTADGERLAFSVMVNGVPSTARAKRSEDEIGARLATFSRGAGFAASPRPRSGARE